jgi:hypothetical protein
VVGRLFQAFGQNLFGLVHMAPFQVIIKNLLQLLGVKKPRETAAQGLLKAFDILPCFGILFVKGVTPIGQRGIFSQK